MHKYSALVVGFALAMIAVPAFAAPPSISAYSSAITDAISAITGAIPAILLAVLAVAAGLLVVKVGVRFARSFIK